MNPGRFYMPGYMGMSTRMLSTPITGIVNSAPRNIGLFSKITNGIRSVNWGGLLNNANRTLNVVNQAIPLVRQAGPMFNNMRSMLKIAKAFGSETTNNKTNNVKKNTNIVNNISSKNTNDDVSIQKKEVQNSNAPNFFV